MFCLDVWLGFLKSKKENIQKAKLMTQKTIVYKQQLYFYRDATYTIQAFNKPINNLWVGILPFITIIALNPTHIEQLNNNCPLEKLSNLIHQFHLPTSSLWSPIFFLFFWHNMLLKFSANGTTELNIINNCKWRNDTFGKYYFSQFNPSTFPSSSHE